MEEPGGPRFEGLGNTMRKKRSQNSRRPRLESLPFPETRDQSPLSSTPPSDDVSKTSSEENTRFDTNSRRKEFNLNLCTLNGSAIKAGEYPLKKIKEDRSHSLSYGDRDFGDSDDQGGNGLNHQRCSEGALAPANWKTTTKMKGSFELQSTTRNGENQNSGNSRMNGDGVKNDNMVKMVKLKVGGVTRTIQTKSKSHGVSGSGLSTKCARTSDAPRSRPKLILQDISDDDSPPDQNSGLQGIPWKDYTRGNSSRGKEDSSMGKIPEKNASGNLGEKLEPVRKSKRVPKRRVLDAAFDEEDEDDEIRYLEKLKYSKVAAGNKDFEEESSKKHQRISRVPKNSKHGEILENFVSLRSSKDSKKSRSERGSDDTDYEEDEEIGSDGEPEGKKKKKLRKDSIDSAIEIRKELALTNRQRALLSSKDASSASGASIIEFPNGLPPAPPRKQKEQLSELEQQLKKAEAAQRRRLQVEKAARESEAEAIRKILGQDSSRKKREDKLKKRREELEQERAASARTLASNTIRWVIGPSSTVVTFSNDMGLPSIFNPKPSSYPPPRERCAGPSCTNPYKYRDSKSKLPLCSLQCYKAMHEKMDAETSS